MTKAVALLSGGLDSTLAVKMMIDQGIEVHALNFTSAFCTCNSGGVNKGGCKSEAKRVSEEFNIPIKVMVKGMDYMEIVRKPRHGYGKGINPCVDCRIYMFKSAAGYMKEIGASFIITGEVLGQRPMSQHREAMRTIERESGLEGMILRPLCAKHLEPTKAEKEGLVDRQKLLDIDGRGRKPQMELAESLDINDYPCPSGGCLLTDKIFSKKVRDLLDNKRELTKKDLVGLRTGRHFRYNGVKIIVGRNEADNEKLKGLMQDGDTLLEPMDFAGPIAVVCGADANGARSFAAALIIKYSSGKAGRDAKLRVTTAEGSAEMEVNEAADEKTIEEHRIC